VTAEKNLSVGTLGGGLIRVVVEGSQGQLRRTHGTAGERKLFFLGDVVGHSQRDQTQDMKG
jgi:hypothetical protein